MLFADIIIHMLYKQKAVLEEEPKMLRYLRGFLVLITAPKIFLSITSCKHTSLLWTAMKVETFWGGSLHTAGWGKEVGGHPSMTAPRVQAAQS